MYYDARNALQKSKLQKVGNIWIALYVLLKIENEKMNKLKENIKNLENLPINMQQWIKELKIEYDKIENNKEELKKAIQKEFTKLRNALNDREDELLLEIDKINSEQNINKDIIIND